MTPAELARVAAAAWQETREAAPNLSRSDADAAAVAAVLAAAGDDPNDANWNILIGAVAFGSATRNTKRGDTVGFWREFCAVVVDAMNA